ncbi:MAG TPA: hypothetical protein PLB87_01520 [Prolixibacteraceae bacterium]|nr:hypothetical protein [Prolixibacteraceae bacterium]
MQRFRWIILFLLSALFFGMPNSVWAQSGEKGSAKIRFVDSREKYSRTYLGTLKKGDIQSLKYDLQNGYSEPVVRVGGPKSQTESEKYVEKITSGSAQKNGKERHKKANKDLVGSYEVESSKSLKKIKEQKLHDRSERDLIQSINQEESQKASRTLSKHYRIKGKRIRNGHSFRKSAGPVCLIIKYTVRDGNYLNSYVNVVEDYLKAGSTYNLKYHGSGSKRKYYLEFASSSK